MKREIIWSYGGGKQTICILVLIAQKKLPRPSLAIMADTGRERQSTWDYLDQYARPLMKDLDIPFVVAGPEYAKVGLYSHKGKLLIPAFTQTGKLPTFCSDEWKKMVVRRKLREIGYGPKKPVINWIGMSLDEVHRLRHSDKKWIENHWPLVMDIPKRKHECVIEIQEFGWPLPSKSSCWCCPNMQNPEWSEIKTDYPDDWQKAIGVDRATRARDTMGGVFLHRDGVPLEDADLSVRDTKFPLLECADTCWT